MVGKREQESGEEFFERCSGVKGSLLQRQSQNSLFPLILGGTEVGCEKDFSARNKGLELSRLDRDSKQESWTCALGRDVSPLET